MKSRQNTFLGIVITLIIFFIAIFSGKYIFKESSVNTIYTLSTELLLSTAAIYFLKPNFNIQLPKLKLALKVFFTGFGISILTMIILSVIEMLIIEKPVSERHPAINKMSVIQVFFYVFIGASFIEEILFRGFLLNMIKPLKKIQISVFKKEIGLHIIISALMFGIGHLILLKTGASFIFVYKIVVSATLLGLFAGYMQEKYNNTSYAILAHMGFNLMAVLGMILMQFIPH